jgi:hypothetical protein
LYEKVAYVKTPVGQEGKEKKRKERKEQSNRPFKTPAP